MDGEIRGFVGLKQVVLGLCLVFAITLAVVVGKKMSTEAMAVVIGVVCGVAASIPTTALLFMVLRMKDGRERSKDDEGGRQSRSGAYPPVVVIQGGTPQALPTAPQAGYWPTPVGAPFTSRQFHVVGEDALTFDGQ